MLQYTIRRLLAAVPVIFGVLIVTFALARAIPGDPCRAILGEKATAESCERFNEEKGLNEPIYVQFGIYMSDLLKGDFGNSLRYNRSIVTILAERLPLTLELGFGALVLAVLIGIPAGIISAIRRNSFFDVFIMIGANIGVSIPVFVLGLLLKYLFAITFRDTAFALPPSGRLTPGVINVPYYELWGWESAETGFRAFMLTFTGNFYILNNLITRNWTVFWDAFRHMILPWIALSSIPLSIIARMTRSAMIEVLGQDYIRTARAKGLAEFVVTLIHAFRNAALPVVTITGLQLGAVFAGAILTETIFGLAGVGLALFEGITARDFPIIQGFVVVVSVGYVLVNLLVDLSYAFIDPRVRLD
jgi:peptide/nickel transport system permease protein